MIRTCMGLDECRRWCAVNAHLVFWKAPLFCLALAMALLFVDGASFKTNVKAIFAGFTLVLTFVEIALWIFYGVRVLLGKESSK